MLTGKELEYVNAAHASANDSVKFHQVKAFGSLQLETYNNALSQGLSTCSQSAL